MTSRLIAAHPTDGRQAAPGSQPSSAPMSVAERPSPIVERLRSMPRGVQAAALARAGKFGVYFDRRLWSLAADCRGRIAFAVVLGLATAAAGVARLALLGWLLGRLFAGAEPAERVAPFVVVVGVIAVRAALRYAKEPLPTAPPQPLSCG